MRRRAVVPLERATAGESVRPEQCRDPLVAEAGSRRAARAERGRGALSDSPAPNRPPRAARSGELGGIVYLVGAGPGDPELLTLRAADLLARADTVVYDRLIHPEVLARARAGARLVFAGKEGGGDQVSQSEINAVLIAQARLGRQVVRLKGGDPFVFGRGAEEALALTEAGIAFEVVPGVSSGIAAPAAAGIPVTHRGLAASVTFASGHLAASAPNWKHLAGAETLVLFMAGKRLEGATRSLRREGKNPSTPAAVVVAGTWEGQRVVEGTLADIGALAEAAQIGSPSLLVVGEVVRLRQQLTVLAAAVAVRSSR
jgi:uroporphyrin-III C-methyltransferase